MSETSNQKPTNVKPNAKRAAATVSGIRAPLGGDEKPQREFTTDDTKKVVTANYTLKLSASEKERYAFTTEFDFANCSQSDILELAAVTVRIWLQNKIRQHAKRDRAAALSLNGYTKINVAVDYIEAERQHVDEITRAVRQLARVSGMSEEDAREYIEQKRSKLIKASDK